MTERAETARTRQGLYRYFGGALLPPVPERLASIGAAGAYLADRGLESFAFYGSWMAFRAAASSADVARLAPEYVALFASGVDGALCPPTESYYRGNARGGEIARVVARVEEEYRELGLFVTNGSEAPDHVVTQLEAMSMLCAREAEAREASSLEATRAALFAQERFLRSHLTVWLPEFRARVAQAPRVSRFYRVLTEAVHAFVVHETDFVAGLRRRLAEATA